MLAEIELDVLQFCDRTVLEGLQTHSVYLRDLVKRHTGTLPLRFIHDVQIGNGTVFVRRTKEQDWMNLRWPGAEEKLLRRVDNAFIHRLQLSFRRDNLPFLQYLRENAEELRCQANALYIIDADVEIDYALVDFLATRLKPQIYESWTDGVREDYAMLFKHEALRGSVKHLEYDFYRHPAPDCLLPELFGVDVVQSCTMTVRVDSRPWIAKFVGMFRTVERGVDIVRFVTLMHARRFVKLPLHDADDPLGRPQRTDVPTPHSAFIKEWAWKQRYENQFTLTESAVAELFVFENAKTARKLEVFVWTVNEAYEGEQTSLHYAFHLRVVDV